MRKNHRTLESARKDVLSAFDKMSRLVHKVDLSEEREYRDQIKETFKQIEEMLMLWPQYDC